MATPSKKRDIIEVLDDEVPAAPRPTPAAPASASLYSAPIRATPAAASAVQASSRLIPSSSVISEPPAKKPRAPPKSSLKPHVLIWICHHGTGQSNKWSMKNPKVIGVYRSKEEAEQKKSQVMSQYQQCGYGDILIGDSWNDEIDLLVRPVEECTLLES
jgi:hypothetical protein